MVSVISLQFFCFSSLVPLKKKEATLSLVYSDWKSGSFHVCFGNSVRVHFPAAEAAFLKLDAATVRISLFSEMSAPAGLTAADLI